MTIEDRKRIACEFLRSNVAGDFDAAFALMTPDATCWLPTDKPGGVVSSRARMQEQVAAFCALFATPAEFTITRVFGEGDIVCLEQTARGGVMRNGAIYENDYLVLFRFEGDKIAEVREYLNPILIEGLGL